MPLIARLAMIFASGAIAGKYIAVSPLVFLAPFVFLFSRRELAVYLCFAVLGLGLGAQKRPTGLDYFANTRTSVKTRIDTLFPREYGLAESLLISERKSLDPEVKAAFATSGLTHLLAISGSHVALIAAMVVTLASIAGMSRMAVGVSSMAGATIYVFFLGAPFAAIRSLVQIALMSAGRALQRPSHPIGLLAVAAILITVIDPSAPLDIGFQLSFAGILGLILWRRPLIELLPRRIPAALNDALGTTLAATIATTPIAAFHFGTVSVVSLMANVVAAPVIAIALPAGVIVVLLSGLSMRLSSMLAPGAELSLTLLRRVAEVSAALPYSHFAVGRMTVILATLTVGVAFYSRRRTVGVMSALFVVIAGPLINSHKQIEIHMIDVGQGDAIAIRSPRGRWILVDAGPKSAKWDAGARRVVPYLLQHNASRVEAIIISHPHLDHFGGVPAVLDQLKVGAIIDPVMPVEGRAFDDLVTDAQGHHIKWLQARTGYSIVLDGMRLDFIGPDSVTGFGADAANDFSAAFKLSYGKFSALFMGDASCKAEAMMKPSVLDVDLLKVGHHGSKTSSCADFLEKVTPSVALVSVGRINRYHHPHPDALFRLTAIGARIFRTDQAGSVTVRVGKDGQMEVSTSS